MSETAGPPEPPAEPAGEQAADEVAPAHYWLRVHGYPVQLGEELVRYADFFDPHEGPLRREPSQLIEPGDVVLYYADGPASLYGVGRVAGTPRKTDTKPTEWEFPVKAEAVIVGMNKAPHAAGLKPPSGWHFLRAVRDYTFIRLPDQDGPYLVAQVKARVSSKGD
jgi:hypothetical protein